MAEHLLRRELIKRGIDAHVIVRSAGIAAYARDGALISLDTRLVLRDEGIDIGEEATSTDLKRHPELLEAADFVIAMTEQQALDLKLKFPAAAESVVHTLRGFAGESGDIEDPFDKGDQVFAACRDQISELIPRIADRLLASLK